MKAKFAAVWLEPHLCAPRLPRAGSSGGGGGRRPRARAGPWGARAGLLLRQHRGDSGARGGGPGGRMRLRVFCA